MLEAVLVSAAVQLALPLFEFRTVQRWAARRTNPPQRVDAGKRDEIVRAVNSVTRRLKSRRRCLLRALAVQWMLRRAGQPADVRIGAAKTKDGGLMAHAWVEQNGEIIAGGSASPLVYRSFESKTPAAWEA